MKASCSISGVKELQATLERQKVRVKMESRRMCFEEAQDIMAESFIEVPKDTGALSESGFIEVIGDGDVTFGYGGGSQQVNPKTGQMTDEYMVEVHERLDVHHNTGKAKFLEDPVNRHRMTLEKSFAAKLRRSFKLS